MSELSDRIGILTILCQRSAWGWGLGVLTIVLGALGGTFEGGLRSGALSGPLPSSAALCLASAAACWTLVRLVARRRGWNARWDSRPNSFSPPAIWAAICLMGMMISAALTHGLLDRPPAALPVCVWSALGALFLAAGASLCDRTARRSLAGLYVCGLIALGMAQIQRGFAPGRFLLWGALCDVAGFVLVAALVGWGIVVTTRALRARSGAPPDADRSPDAAACWSSGWFGPLQAVLAVGVACLTAWVASDLGFDGVGQDEALFGLSGLAAACPAALMLVGATILMAWQSRGVWRTGWQYAAFAAGLMFTTSVGWARIDVHGVSVWPRRAVHLFVCVSMMTLLTGMGLTRVLPGGNDWIERGRRVMPVLASLGLTLAILLVADRFFGW